ncbi:MAG: GTPase HflX [Omnitrophica bacterium RIFCSPHIGHO2_02_FULL_51_18]|nr:MAG: GTPase HflX [Omnitrophica bacterium RIFCSPHIGHO2_02_FULL_51_18]
MTERALLVTVEFHSMPRQTPLEDFAKELEALASSAGLQVIQNLKARQKAPNPALLVGEGKAQEIKALVAGEKIDVVVFGMNLSATQQRNIEALVQAKTIDRTQLILDIFAQRARSNEGKLQVELAQLNYLLPRLTGKGIALSRLGGGVGTRGPGEQKLEVDRRRVRERLARLSRELSKLQERRSQSIRKKKEKELPLVSLVGYTNSGKSTLFNALTRASVTVRDQLFSTLDTTTRLLILPGNQRVFLADTVGFVRALPHTLVEAFKATLEEARQADLLLHVVDSSRPDAGLLVEAVNCVLDELGIRHEKVILVLNKADLVSSGKTSALVNYAGGESAFVSAKTGEALQELCLKIADFLSGGRDTAEIFVPKERLGLAHWLYEEGQVLERRNTALGAHFMVRLTDKAKRIFVSRLGRADSLT